MTPDYFRTVMPSVFVPEDATWIQEQMAKLSPSMRQKIALNYAVVYQETFDAEPVSFRQENRARHEANTRLRLFVERYHRAAMGLVEKPKEVIC
ncbi:hypothetical protein NG99_16980 [Erwinia typographi]|uniref:Uncharacterized protein n=1 Tax=Erwinia typographi TaxID=371042 RepID=A0A0A3YXB2_9GAMM|nr:hypothetical protein [Erwinia typographi]KGT91260.1 hypothetical protein NG99_16980 [Erwinia typographi]